MTKTAEVTELQERIKALEVEVTNFKQAETIQLDAIAKLTANLKTATDANATAETGLKSANEAISILQGEKSQLSIQLEAAQKQAPHQAAAILASVGQPKPVAANAADNGSDSNILTEYQAETDPLKKAQLWRKNSAKIIELSKKAEGK